MRKIIALALFFPTLSFAAEVPPPGPTDQQITKPPMQQATEAITMEQLAAHQMWRAKAIALDAMVGQNTAQLQGANAKIEVLEKSSAATAAQLTDAQKQIADLQAKLDISAKAQIEQASKCDAAIKSEQEKSVIDHEVH